MRSCVLALALMLGVVSLSPTPAQAASLIPASAIAPCSPVYYVVQSGDWLSKIAAAHNLTWQQLYALNQRIIGSNPNLIYPGQVLRICPTSASPAPTPSPTPSPAPTGGSVSPLEFCHSTTYWPSGAVYMWEVPVGCYGGIYYPNPRAYPYKAGYGWCNWWPEELHPSWNIWTLPKHRTPKIGAAVWFVPGEQGASSVGHWGGEVIAIRGNWILLSEMNDSWRGGGFGRVNYRYVWIDNGVWFVYP